MTDWRETTLGKFVSLQRGHDLPAEQRRAGSVPVMGSFGITGWHDQARALGPGVTVGRSGASVGVVSYIDRDYWPLNTCLFATNFHGNNPRFVYYFLQTLDLAAHNSGSAQPSLNRNYISPIKILVPEPGIQNDIVNLLGSLDNKIELNRRMNETLEAMAQAIFRDWFVDFGPTRRKLEGATDPLTIMGGLVQDAERAQALADLFPAALADDGLPEGWENKPLLDQASWVNGAAYKNMHFSDAPDALPVVKIAELKNGVTSSTKRTNTALGERYRISHGELLFSWSGNPDTSIDAFVWIGGDAWLNQHIFAVRENGTRSRAALYVLLKALMPQFAELARNKQTTGLGHVTKEDMKRLEIAVAPGPVEAAFEEVITPVFNLIVSKLFENRTLAATRDLLLPKLMSGEIRLSEAEDLMEAAQ